MLQRFLNGCDSCLNRSDRRAARLLRRDPPYRRLHCEPLEDRRMLHAAVDSETIELFDTSSALFVENQGQWADESVRYGFHGAGANISFTDAGLDFQLLQRAPVETDDSGDPLAEEPEFITHTAEFSVRFDAANPVTPVGLERAETRFNYFIGDQANWRRDVPGYQVVAYEDLYPGIDLHTLSRRESLKYEFHVAPGADYRQIQVNYEGTDGLWLDNDGSLHVQTELGELVDNAPYVYQEIDGEQVEVAGAFVLLDADSYGFEISGSYDAGLPLVIDPDLAWSTYLGGRDPDFGWGVAVDVDGNVLVTGSTGSSNFPTTDGALDENFHGNAEAFVTKFDPSGSLLWSTYLGGSEPPVPGWNPNSSGSAIAIDVDGSVVVTGMTSTPDFPTTAGAFDRSLGGNHDAFVTKLGPSGSLLWSTYLGGSENTPWGPSDATDRGSAIAVDAVGNVLVTGTTRSSDFPTTAGAFDRSYNRYDDAFVTKFGPSGSLLWSTYLNGSESDDEGVGIAADPAGNVLVTGRTTSSEFPTTAGAFDRSFNGGDLDAFVTKFGPSGSLLWSTYLGGSENEYGGDIVTDAAGDVLVTGKTYSSDFPTTAGAFDRGYNGNGDAFVTKFGPSGSLLWSTYLGGSENENHHTRFGAIAVGAVGNVLVVGTTYSSDFPTTAGAFDRTLGGSTDAFVTEFDPSGLLLWSTYLGGSEFERVGDIAVDAAGNVLVTGFTGSTDFPTTPGAYDTSYNGSWSDAFVAKFTFTEPVPLLGDLNNDGQVNGLDVDPFVASLVDGEFTAAADMNQDGVVNGLDVDLFVAAVV